MNQLVIAYAVGELSGKFPVGTWVLRIPGSATERRYINLTRGHRHISAYVAKASSSYRQRWKMDDLRRYNRPLPELRNYVSRREALLAGERVDWGPDPATAEPTIRRVIKCHLLVRKPRLMLEKDSAFSIVIAGVKYAYAVYHMDAPRPTERMFRRLVDRGHWEPMLRGELGGLLQTRIIERNRRPCVHVAWSHLHPASRHLQQWSHDNWEALT